MNDAQVVAMFQELQNAASPVDLSIRCVKMEVYDNQPGFSIHVAGQEQSLFACSDLVVLQTFLLGYCSYMKEHSCPTK